MSEDGGPRALTLYYCKNPSCPRRGAEGHAHVVLKANLAPGSFVMAKCRYCRTWTVVETPVETPTHQKA